MEHLISALVLIFLVLRGLYAFFRWIVRSLKGVSATPATRQPAQPMTRQLPGEPPSSPKPLRTSSQADAWTDQSPRWQHKPETASANFRATERENMAQIAITETRVRKRYQATRRQDAPKQALRRPTLNLIELESAPSLLESPSELLRGIILHEILAPPISQRGDPRGRGSF